MKPEIIEAIRECTVRSDDNSLTFPQVVARLAQAGVERYHADLQRSKKAHFLADGEAYVEVFKAPQRSVAENFSAARVEQAVRAIQRDETTYGEFLAEIMAAGCCDYFVYVRGGRTLYLGRGGESYVELFPCAK